MRHRYAKQQRLAARRVVGQPLPLLQHQAGAHVVAGDELVERRQLARLVPGDVGKIGVVVAGVVLEGAQQLQVQRVPQAQLDGGRAIGAVVKVTEDGPAVAALRRGGQAQQYLGPYRGDEGVEAVGGQAVAFVQHHAVPVAGAVLRQQLPAGDAVDGGEQVVVLFWLAAIGQQFAKAVVAQHLAVGAQGLAQDFGAVSHEQQARAAAGLRAAAPVVERRDHGFAGAGGGHHQIAPAAVFALDLQLLQHVLLVALGLQVEVGGARQNVAARFALQRLAQGAPVLRVAGVVGLELAVFPQGFKVRLGVLEQIALAALGEFHRPLQSAHQCRARQIGAAHIGRAKAAPALE